MNKFLFAFLTLFLVVNPVIAIEEIKYEPEQEEQRVLKGRSLKSFYKEGLSKTFEAGIVKEVQLQGGYQGFLNFTTYRNSSSTNSKYKYLVGDVRVRTIMRDDSLLLFQMNTARFSRVNNTLYNKISDYYYRTSKIYNHNLIIGQRRTPIGFEGGQSQYTLFLANRAMISRILGNSRPLGVGVRSDWGLADYDIGFYDSGRLLNNVGEGSEFTGWLNLKPLNNISEKYGELKIGTGLLVGKRETNYNVFGSYISYKKNKFFIDVEYALADGYNGNSISGNKAQGLYSTIAYDFTPKIQLVGRYDYFDPNTDVSQNSKREYSVGLNYYFLRQKLKAVVNFVHGVNDVGPDSNKFILMTQILI